MKRTILFLIALFTLGMSAVYAHPAAQTSKGGDLIRQWANFATGSSQYGSSSWSFMQATGAPNTNECGDRSTAWASATSRGSDILALEFEQAVIPTQVNIHQTFTPGSITRIELTNTDTGEIFQIPNSADAPGNTPCPGVFTVNTSVTAPVNGVIIYLDQTIGGSWNEIDAVELVGTSSSATVPVSAAPVVEELRQWGSSAVATNQFGEVGWSAMQATGAPDSPTCGDSLQAYASASSSGQATLTVEFETPVIPTQVNIYQVYNPGSITNVILRTVDDTPLYPIPNSADPLGNTPCPGVFTLDISGVTSLVDAVIIDIDQSAIGNYNEIDAVELVGTTGSVTAETSTAAPAVEGFVSADIQGLYTLEYPDTWAADLTGPQPIIASSESALALTEEDDPGSDVRVMMILPASLAQFGVTPDMSAADVVDMLASGQFGSTTPITDYTAVQAPAAYVEVGGSAPAGSHLIAVQAADGFFLFAIRSTQFDAYADAINHIINSLVG